MNADAPTVDPTLFQYIADWPWYGQLIGFLAILAVPTFAWWMGKRGAAKAAPLILLGALALMLAGCGTMPKEYLNADQATLDSVGAEWIKYVDADESLDTNAKQLRHGKLETWQKRIDAAMKGAD